LLAILYQAKETAIAAKAASDSVAGIKRQADIMERQTAAIEKSVSVMVTENRPYVLIALEESALSCGSPRINPPEFGVSCDFFIKNYGKVPAQKIMVWAELTVDSSKDDATPLGPDCLVGGINRMKVLPGGCVAMQSAMYSEGVPMLIDHFDEVFNRKKWLWLRGKILYRFADGEESRPDYETNFSFRWIRISKDDPWVGKWIPAHTEESNKAT
jgi:hypothetical protein